LYLSRAHLRFLYSFQNKRQIFDIVANVKFDLVVAANDHSGTDWFLCAFYLYDDEWLFDKKGRSPLRYTRDFVCKTGGEYYTFIELRSEKDAAISQTCAARNPTFGQFCEEWKVHFGSEIHMAKDAWRFTPSDEIVPEGDPRDPDALERLHSEGVFIISDEDSLHLYTDHWTARPRYLAHARDLDNKVIWIQPARYYRLFFRRIATVVDARSFMAAVVPPGWISGSPQANRNAGETPAYVDLLLLAVIVSFVADWNLRLRITATLNVFIVNAIPLPSLNSIQQRFLAHSALRLTCNHLGYAPLWQEQLAEAWREPSQSRPSWPVLGGSDERWEIRAAIAAVVADAYGLTRDQYAHVLSTFSHASYPKAPELCLAKFDELHAIGLDAFTKKYDPYWDIPLNENLPQPVIDIPIPGAESVVREQEELFAGEGSGIGSQGVWGPNDEVAGGETDMSENKRAQCNDEPDDEELDRLALDLGVERDIVIRIKPRRERMAKVLIQSSERGRPSGACRK
jgi:hypothetical protein